MSDFTVNYPEPALPLDGLLSATRTIVDNELEPLTIKIDLDGYYPEEVLRKLGTVGAFNQHLPATRADGLADMGAAIQTMGAV